MHTHTHARAPHDFQITTQLLYALRPALTDLSLDWEGIEPKTVAKLRQAPFRFPPLFSGDRLVVYAFLPGNFPKCTAKLRAVTTSVRWRLECMVCVCV